MDTNDRTEMKILKGPSGNDISHEEFTKIRDYLIDALITEIFQGSIKDHEIEKTVYSGRGRKKYACVVVHSKAAAEFVRNAIAEMRPGPSQPSLYTVWSPEAFNQLTEVFHFEVVIRGLEKFTSDYLAKVLLKFNRLKGEWKKIKTDPILKRTRTHERQRKIRLEADEVLLDNLRLCKRRPEDYNERLPPNTIPLRIGFVNVDLVPTDPKF